MYYNSLMKITQEKILNFLHELKPTLKERGIEKVALFGSFAKGEEGVYSDIDIAIKKAPDFFQHYSVNDYFGLIAELRTAFLKRLHRRADFFDLDSESSFKQDIEKELIYV